MLTGFAVIFISGLALGELFKRLHLPSLMGMIIAGIIIGPCALDLLNDGILELAPDLRQIALVIILTRAGLNLNIDDLKRVGISAVLMCFVPACFEICATTIIAPMVFDISHVEAALMGTVLGAVSPAVIVPRMIRIMDEGYGTKKSVPQLVMAGASADDIFVIVLFTAFLSLASGGDISVISFVNIPVSIVLGIALGIVCGILLNALYKRFDIRGVVKVIIMLSVSFLLLEAEDRLENYVAVSGLLAIMSMGVMVLRLSADTASELSAIYNKLWTGGEILLFVLVGAAVDVSYALNSGVYGIIVLLGALAVRMTGVYVSVLPSGLNTKEKLFCMFSYIPKATVQAAIGAVPLSMGLACGHQVLTVAVLSILISAPVGAILVENTYKKFLSCDGK